MSDFDFFGERPSPIEVANLEQRAKEREKKKSERVRLSEAEKISIAAFARSHLQIAPFFQGIEGRDYISTGQHAIVQRWRGWYPRVVASLPVKNRYAGCWTKGCKQKATVVYDSVGYCAKHAAEAAKTK